MQHCAATLDASRFTLSTTPLLIQSSLSRVRRTALVVRIDVPNVSLHGDADDHPVPAPTQPQPNTRASQSQRCSSMRAFLFSRQSTLKSWELFRPTNKSLLGFIWSSRLTDRSPQISKCYSSRGIGDMNLVLSTIVAPSPSREEWSRQSSLTFQTADPSQIMIRSHQKRNSLSHTR
jgi:hypothetical protein